MKQRLDLSWWFAGLLKSTASGPKEVSEEVHKRTELQQHIRALDQADVGRKQCDEQQHCWRHDRHDRFDPCVASQELRAAQNDIRASGQKENSW